MFLVEDIYDESKKILGTCDDVKLFRWLGDAASLVVNKADLEGLKFWIDICTAGCACSGASPCSRTCGRQCLSLPREVETVLAVNIGGRPSLGLAQNFSWHLNGSGDCCTGCNWSWEDLGANHYTYRDLITPAKVIAYLQNVEDNGKKLIVYGYDSEGNQLRRQVNGQWVNGYQVPTIFGIAVPDDGAPTIARITAVQKDVTVGTVRLSTIDDSGLTGVTLGVYEASEVVPQYRRIRLNRCATWARVAGMKASPHFTSRSDHIPLKSRRAFLMAVQAVKLYSELDLAGAHAFEADAARMEIEAQQKLDAPLYFPIQVVDMNSIRDKSDYWME